eukprot:c21074_g1_i1.p1 GENE.c21074_g1_i1~~c21074_g1_i1.p1  ORF type:complete len:273 (-),score=49.88 c21074_g1_i1:85-879(-)
MGLQDADSRAQVVRSLLIGALVGGFLLYFLWKKRSKKAPPATEVVDIIERLRRQRQARVVPIPPCPDYDPLTADSLSNFRPVQTNTHCAFASAAKVWGGYTGAADLEANVRASLEKFADFALHSAEKEIDAFLFQLPHPDGKEGTLDAHTECIARLLKVLSHYDPEAADCVGSPRHLMSASWKFMFAGNFFFITSFAACYETNHPRFAFGASPNSSFVLFQPEESFSRHVVTDAIRERIMQRFESRGRPMWDLKIANAYVMARH